MSELGIMATRRFPYSSGITLHPLVYVIDPRSQEQYTPSKVKIDQGKLCLEVLVLSRHRWGIRGCPSPVLDENAIEKSQLTTHGEVSLALIDEIHYLSNAQGIFRLESRMTERIPVRYLNWYLDAE